MAKVYNKHAVNVPKNVVYIGRGSPWGNPFKIGPDGTRDDVVRKFREYAINKPGFIDDMKKHLAGKDLLCFCAPHKCHGDVIIELIENSECIAQ